MLNCKSLQEAFNYCPTLVGKTFEDLIRRSEANTPEMPEVSTSANPKRSGLPDLLLVDEGQRLFGFGHKVREMEIIGRDSLCLLAAIHRLHEEQEHYMSPSGPCPCPALRMMLSAPLGSTATLMREKATSFGNTQRGLIRVVRRSL